MDFRLKNGAVLQVVGPSGSGKTFFVCKLLTMPNIFKAKINKIYWLRGTEEGEYNDSKTEHCMITLKKKQKFKFVNGFVPGWEELAQKNDVMVIDDLFHESTKEKNFINLFTKIARHRSVFVIFMTQNLFHQGGNHRTRNLNVHYLAVFRNPRDKTVIDHLARQVYPQNRIFLIDAFDDATFHKPYAYLFFDFTQECEDDLRIRTNVLLENTKEQGVVVYKQVPKDND